MKGGVEHRVPLSPVATDVPRPHGEGADWGIHLFRRAERPPLSNMALLVLLKRMKRTDITSHGFRSTFRDWAAERGYADPVAEACLAHKVSDAVIAAYKRTNFFDLRKQLMADWAAFASTDPTKTGDNVVELRTAQ